MVLIVVAAALIDDAGRVLIQQRPPGKQLAGLWEFPGGKVDPGESPERALVRELDEELGIAVDAADLTPLTFASQLVGDRHIVLLLYRATRWTGLPKALEASALAWTAPDALDTVAMPDLDRPFTPFLRHPPAP